MNHILRNPFNHLPEETPYREENDGAPPEPLHAIHFLGCFLVINPFRFPGISGQNQ
jgi:hypothetical protein